MKLDENNEQAIVRLAEIARLKGDKEKAIEYYNSRDRRYGGVKA